MDLAELNGASVAPVRIGGGKARDSMAGALKLEH
jgi:hypothetical protein